MNKISSTISQRPSIILYSYYIITLSLITDVILSISLNMSLSGYWSDRILFWIWFVATIIIIIIFKESKYAKKYVKFLILLVVLTIIPMFIPFSIIISEILGASKIADFDNKYIRLQLVQEGMRGEFIQVIQKLGLVEKQIGEIEYKEFRVNDCLHTFNQIKSFQILQKNDNSMSLELTFETGKVLEKIIQN